MTEKIIEWELRNSMLFSEDGNHCIVRTLSAGQKVYLAFHLVSESGEPGANANWEMVGDRGYDTGAEAIAECEKLEEVWLWNDLHPDDPKPVRLGGDQKPASP